MKEKVLFSWSGGKDSALALLELLRDDRFRVTALLTTVTEDCDRTSLHGVRRALLEEQAASLGLPLEIVLLPTDCSIETFERRMRQVLERQKANGTTTVAIGDILLDDLRKYREEKLGLIGMKPVFPIWGRDTKELARTFLSLGFKAVVTCVDTQMLDRSFAGREFDTQFLADLPAGVDPCGENGEYHSFVYDGPIFARPIEFTRGEVVLRENRFCFSDLLPKRSPPQGEGR